MIFRSLAVIFSLALILISSGCISPAGTDITSIAKSLPEVKSFLKEYPNAKIVVALWENETVQNNIESIRGECGQQMKVTEYYRVTISDPSLSLVVWLDKSDYDMVCAVRQVTDEAVQKEEGKIIEGEKEISINAWLRACDHIKRMGCDPEIDLSKLNVSGIYETSGKEVNAFGACFEFTGKKTNFECIKECCGKIPYCGDSECKGKEDASSCPKDCIIKTMECGNNLCDSSEEFSSCPQDCGYELYPYEADVSYCIDSTGATWPSTGKGYAPWFIWNGCSHKKIYNVNPGEKIAFHVYTDSCSSCVCNYPNFYVFEYSEGTWVKKEFIDLPDEQGIAKNVYYTPASSRIKVQASGCFYLKIYSRSHVIPTTTTVKTCTDSDNGRNYYQLGSATSAGQALTDHCNSDGSLTEKYCDGNEIRAETYRCPYGCSEGKCKNYTTTTLQPVDNWDIAVKFEIANQNQFYPFSAEPGILGQTYYKLLDNTDSLYEEYIGKECCMYPDGYWGELYEQDNARRAKAWYAERIQVSPTKYRILIRGVAWADCSYSDEAYVKGSLWVNSEKGWRITEIVKNSTGGSNRGQDTYFANEGNMIRFAAGNGCGGCCACADAAGLDIEIIVELNPTTTTTTSTTSTTTTTIITTTTTIQNWFCNDTDSFYNYSTAYHTQRLATKGICADNSGVYEDYCSGSSLVDYYCGPLSMEPKSCLGTTTYNCLAYGFTGCQNGACVNATTTTTISTTTTSTTLPFMNQTLDFYNVSDRITIYSDGLPYEFELKGYGSDGKTGYFYINGYPTATYGWVEGSVYNQTAFNVYVMNVTVTPTGNQTETAFVKLLAFR